MFRQARNQGGFAPRTKFFALPGKMFWTYFQTIGRSSKNLGPSHKTLRPLMSQAGYRPVFRPWSCRSVRNNCWGWKYRISWIFIVTGWKKINELQDLEPSFVEELVKLAVYFRNCNAVKSSSSCEIQRRWSLKHFNNWCVMNYLKYCQIVSSPTTFDYINCSGERSFSKLRQLKSCMRSTTGQKRLQRLVVLYDEHPLARKIN